MSSALAVKPIDEPAFDRDQRMVLTGISWETYVAMRDALGENPGIRLFYLEGSLEIMSPSRQHEYLKTTIGRLIERFAEERDIRLLGYGSTTFKARARARGLEPDECYFLDVVKEVPDIALEVVVSSGGLDKLEIYRGLGMGEVWFWEEDGLSIFRLRGERYDRIERSEILPGLDPALLAEYATWPDQHEAVKAFVRALRVG